MALAVGSGLREPDEVVRVEDATLFGLAEQATTRSAIPSRLANCLMLGIASRT
jgi:hypothetical protein